MLIFSEVDPARNSSAYAKELDEVVAQLGFSTNSLQLSFQLHLQDWRAGGARAARASDRLAP